MALFQTVHSALVLNENKAFNTALGVDPDTYF